MYYYHLISYLILFLSLLNLSSVSYIRINQVGYSTKEPKWAIVGSDHNLAKQKYVIKDTRDQKIAYSGILGPSLKAKGADTPFFYNTRIQFSQLEREGRYQIVLDDCTSSYEFCIGDNIYKGIIDSLLFFLKAARCGDNEPALHDPCHLSDATNIEFDLTGGWHDAGDYLKFTEKEAYTTYLLLLSYDINKDNSKIVFSDKNKNGFPDILDEAQIGLQYLVKLFPDENTFVLQVGDTKKDHSQGTRLPEVDKLSKRDRPAKIGFERDPLCKYAYTLALGYNIFKEFPSDISFAKRCLELAKIAYEKTKKTGIEHHDKLCLAAIELYLASGEKKYLKEAEENNIILSKSSWGNTSNNTNFAHARLAPYFASALLKLKESVGDFYQDSETNLFGFNIPYFWGSLYVGLSSANAGWFYYFLAKDSTFNKLQKNLGNYLLGMNPWGVCFISGIGTDYPKRIHNGLARALKKQGKIKYGTLLGAVAEGPFSRKKWEEKYESFVPQKEDIYRRFHTSECVYHDHENDYVTNEPCIYGVAETILFFSFYQKYIYSLNASAF